MKKQQPSFLVVSFISDWRFFPERSRTILRALIDAKRQVTYVEIEAEQGHEAFLMPLPLSMQTLHAYETGSTRSPLMRLDLDIISEWIKPNARILDLG